MAIQRKSFHFLGIAFISLLALKAMATTAPLPSTCMTAGNQRIAVIIATYPGANAPVPNLTYLQELFSGESSHPAPSVADYYAQVSAKKLSLGKIDFYGPYSFPSPYAVDSSQVKMQGQGTYDYDRAILALARGEVDLRNYDRLVFISPEALDSKTGQSVNMMGGLSSSGCTQSFFDGRVWKNMGVSWIPSVEHLTGARPERAASPSLWARYSPAQKTAALLQLKIQDMRNIIHELGHTFGLGHANAILDPSQVLPSAQTPVLCKFYSDFYDVMGDSVTAPLSVPHRESMGWLVDGELQTVNTSGVYRVYAFGSLAGSVKGLKIARAEANEDDENDAFFWVEYRNGKSTYELSSELEKTLPQDGALIHYTNPKQAYASQEFHWPNETLLLDFKPAAKNFDEWSTGQLLKTSWKDPYSPVGFEVIRVTPDYLDVKVTLSP